MGLFFVLKDTKHEESAVWAAEEGFFCLRTGMLIRMRLAQQKVDSPYNMFLPLWLGSVFTEAAIYEPSCHVLSSNWWLFLFSDSCSFWLHQWQFASGWLYQSFALRKYSWLWFCFHLVAQNPSHLQEKSYLCSCATHIIEKYPLYPAYFLFWQNMSRAAEAVVSATLLSCTVLLKEKYNRSSHHIKLLYRWQGLETWARSPCFEFSISMKFRQLYTNLFFFNRRALHSFSPWNFGVRLQQRYSTLDKEVKIIKGSIWRKAFAWATHCACLLMAPWDHSSCHLSFCDRESSKSCMWTSAPRCAFGKLTDRKWEVKITQEPLYFIEVRWSEQVKVNTFPCKYIFPMLPEFKSPFPNREQKIVEWPLR